MTPALHSFATLAYVAAFALILRTRDPLHREGSGGGEEDGSENYVSHIGEQ